MHATSLFATIVALSATVSAGPLLPRALRKANEFSSGDCAQGTASYEHHSNYNVDVTMDDTSNAVYFASGPWYFYSGKSANGGVCTGDVLGSWENDTDNPCVNLNQRPGDSRRIQCVKWNNGVTK